ncbi:MAG: sigma-70 family RNA polymerase sigma factor [Verrucomicrobiales bacterium]
MTSSDSSHQSSSGAESSGNLFPPTRWTLIAGAGQHQNQELQHRALSELCRIYWHPIYVVLRKRGSSPEDAEDLTQELFARLLRSDSFASARKDLGKLRTYLLTSVTRLATEKWRRDSAIKRGSGQKLISIDVEIEEQRFHSIDAEHITPESMFDRRWALALLKEVELRLASDYAAQGKGKLFEALKPFLAGKPSEQDADGGYAAIAATLSTTVPGLKMQMRRLRAKFRDTMREEIAATLTSPTDEQVEEEMQHLYAALRPG